MGRRKIEIKPIKDDRNRSVTFLKRKGGLFKKAHELSVLCSVDVAVIIFGNNNKKLYQYSSGDIQEIISRHSYYDMPHESKGPNDFKGKKDVGDDDDDDDIPIEQERANSHSSNDHALPHHLHGHPGLPHMANRHTASASPPIASKAVIGAPGSYSIPGRVGTPPSLTRPSSRNAMQRRNSSNLVPSNAYPSTQAPAQNGAYAYMSQQPVYNSQGQPVVPMQSGINQIPGYTYHPQQQPQTEAQAQAQAYITDTSRRQSMPPTFAPERPMPSSENSPPHTVEDTSATAVEKRAPAKSRSMYTPIGPSDSLLAQHFGFGQGEPTRSHSVDVGAIQRKTAAASAASTTHVPVKSEDRHEYSPKSVPAPPPPPPPSTAPPTEALQPHPVSRTNSMEGAKPGVRPRLKVRIPSEHSDAGSATEESSPRASSGTTGAHSAKGASEGSHGIHLPPPSPSVSALLSAGANGGPSNPFARPPPTSSAPEQTPMSALPSRFTESMLPSPSSFYPDNWGVPFPQSRSSNGDNMLPSPLNFQTPVAGSASQPIFKDAESSNKRKSPEPDSSEGSVVKRRKS